MIFKYILVAGVSAGVTYLVANQRLSKVYETRLERDSDEIREFWREHYRQKFVEDVTKTDPEFAKAAIDTAEVLSEYANIQVDPEKLASALITAEEKTFAEEAVVEVQEPEPVAVESLVSNTPQLPVVNYNAISTPPKATKEEKAEGKTENGEESQIERIDAESYMGNYFSYTQSSLTYFAEDDVLSTPSDKIVTRNSRLRFVGEEYLHLLKNLKHKDTLYLRNHESLLELEIEYNSGSYTKVAGVPIEDADIAEEVNELE